MLYSLRKPLTPLTSLTTLLPLTLLIVLALQPTSIALADTEIYTSSFPPIPSTFQSPTLTDSLCQATNTMDQEVLGVPFRFQAQSFRVTRTGTYTLTNINNTFTDRDSILLLYVNYFDPTRPLQNLIAVNDDIDFNNNILTSSISCPLVARVPYTLVTSSYDHLQAPISMFTNSISGPGNVVLVNNLPRPLPCTQVFMHHMRPCSWNVST